MILSIIGAIVLVINGISDKEIINVVLGFVAAVFGVCTSLAVVYAADVPIVKGIAQSASAKADSRAMTVAKDLDALKSEVHKLKVEVKTLKEQLKEKNEEN